MDLTIVAFGIAKDIIGGSSIRLQVTDDMSVAQLKEQLVQQYPAFSKLRSLAIAVNSQYAQDNDRLHPQDDIVLIPPVSGG